MKKIILPNNKEDTIKSHDIDFNKSFFIGFLSNNKSRSLLLFEGYGRSNFSCLNENGSFFTYKKQLKTVEEHYNAFGQWDIEYFYFESFQDAMLWLTKNT